MEDKLITLAIHTPEKARILKYALEDMGVTCTLVDISGVDEYHSGAIAVKIKESDMMKAITVIEGSGLFRYDDKKIQKIDDGRRRILVAVDFSDYSLKACRVAFAIAHKVNAKVKILHVYKIRFPLTFPFAEGGGGEDNNYEILDRARRQMLDFCSDIDKKISEKDFPSVNYSYSLREGIVEEEIDNFVDEYKPFLLVVGTRGKTNNQQNVIGNVTADIIEMTNVPIMAVPEKSPIKSIEDIKHVAFLTNFQKADLESFDKLVYLLLPHTNIRMTLVHVNAIDKKGDKWTEAELAKMKEYFLERYPNLNVGYKVIDSPDMRKAMEEFIKEEKVSVLTLNTKRRNLFGRIFMPSISRKVLSNFDVTLLILRG